MCTRTTGYILLDDKLEAKNHNEYTHTYTIGLQSKPDWSDEPNNSNGILFHTEDDMWNALLDWEAEWIGVVTLCKDSDIVRVSYTTCKTNMCVISAFLPAQPFFAEHAKHNNITVTMIEKTPGLLNYVEEQTTEMCMAAVRTNGYAIQWVRQVTLNVCLTAVRQDGRALKFINLDLQSLADTHMIITEALTQNAMAFFDIPKKNITTEICWIMIRLRPDFISCCPSDYRTHEMWEFAIHQQPNLIKELSSITFTKNPIQKTELFAYALKQDGLLLKHVRPSQSRELCEIAVRQNGEAIQFVWDSFRTPELYMIAVCQNGRALKLIPSIARTPELEHVALIKNGL